MTLADDPIAEYHLGQQITLFVDYTDEEDDPADPDVVTLLILEGDGTTTTTVLHASLSNPSVGRWEYDITIPLDGNYAIKPWLTRWEGASGPGGVTAADEHRFEVIPSPFYPAT